MATSSIWDQRPSPDEYGPFYKRYINKLGPGNILDILTNQRRTTYMLINSLNREQALYRYDEGKWTVKEVIGHMIDTERIFSYRVLAICRNDPNELTGFDQDDYVAAANFNDRTLQNLADEYDALRKSNIQLFKSFNEDMLERRGVANNYELSVRAIPFIIAGHERHHLELLASRYKLDVPI